MMEGMETIDDIETQKKVESLAGKGTRVIDCEKSTCFSTEEVLLVNGYPVPLQGEEGIRIKNALISGQVPPCELLNEILIRAGILKNPVELETTVQTKSTTKTTELVTLRDKNGQLVDERMKEVEEDNQFSSTTTELWKQEAGKTGVTAGAAAAATATSSTHQQPEVIGLGKQLEKMSFPNTSSIIINGSSTRTSTSSPTASQRNPKYFATSTTSPRMSPGAYSHSSASSSGVSTERISPISKNSPSPSPTLSSSTLFSSSPRFSVSRNRFNSPNSNSNSEILSPRNTDENESLSGIGNRSTSKPLISLTPPASLHIELDGVPPSIFGTVANSPSPDPVNHQRKTLPQTQIIGNGSIPNGESHNHHHHHHHRNGSSSISSTCSSTSSTSSTTSTEDVNHSSLNGTYASTSLSTNPRNDWDNALVYQDTNLVAGTLDALIQHLVPSQTYYPNRAYIFAFLLSSRLYIRPHELLGRVFRLAVATSQHSTKFHTARETKIISHVVQLLGEWAELFPYDFRDERMMAHVRTITQKCVSVDPLIRKDVSQLLTTLLARLTALERYEDFLHRINTEAALAEPLTAPSILTICPNPTMLSQQLTHIELERLSHIGPEEFVQAFAKDNTQVETKYKDMKKTRNLESYVQWFNRLSYYVATEICKMPKKKSRIRVIEYWIEAARECFNIGNFNSLMAIIAGLNMSPVARLKKTWAKVSSAQLSILEHQMDPSSNFTSYRSTLKAAVWRSAGATDERQRIVIPFFSLLVKDLYFLNEGCASKLPNGHINFDKFWQLAKQVTEVMAWQQITCPFPKVQAVLNSLQTVPIFSENALCLSSYECEAADNAQEKERLKYLRQDGGTNNKKVVVGSSTTGTNGSAENTKEKKTEDLKK